jgi:hypothetical protein
LQARCLPCITAAATGNDPEQCVNPAQDPAWDEGEDVYYACPERFIPANVIRWHEQYCYEKEFGSQVAYPERSSKFLDAEREYKGLVQYWNDLLHPKTRPGG